MESTLKRTWAEIDLAALAHNYHTLRQRTGSNVRFLGVVKADAYGHGAIKTAELLQELGADYLAVSSIDEAQELRECDITMPILILGHTPKEQVGKLIDLHITQAVSCLAKAEEFSAEAAKHGGMLKVHIKVDTGMSRLGFLCGGDHFDGAVEGIYKACNLPHLEAEGIFTHFAVSDVPDEESRAYTLHQFSLFRKVIDGVADKGYTFRLRHCTNTGAMACYPEAYLDMVRPGLLLYGCGEFAEELGLKPVMALKTTVSTIKIYDPNTSISYGRLFTTDKATRIGVVPYGYADGFFRVLTNRCSFWAKGLSLPQRGRICMDMCMIDLSDAPDIQVGDEVEIFGKNNSINQMAEWAGTIPYELTCAVSKRVPRVYLRGGKVVGRELLLRSR